MIEEKKDKKINPSPEDNPKAMIGPDGLRVPHVGKKKIIPLSLFKTGPNRGGSLGNWVKKRK